jgi:hypothetical protein
MGYALLAGHGFIVTPFDTGVDPPADRVLSD